MADMQPPQQDLATMRKNFFNQRRQETLQNVNQQGQQAQDAIQRRFASLGAQGSGAQFGVAQDARNATAEQGRQATRDIDQGEIQANMAAQEAQAGRDFQSSEAQKARDLQNQMFGTEQQNKLKQLDLAERNFQLEKDAQEFNKQMAEIEAGRKPPGLLDSIGLGGIKNQVSGAGNLAGSIGGVGGAITNASTKILSGGK